MLSNEEWLKLTTEEKRKLAYYYVGDILVTEFDSVIDKCFFCKKTEEIFNTWNKHIICIYCFDKFKKKEEKKRMIQTNKQIMKEMGIAPEEFREKDYLWSNNRFTDEELEVFKQKGIIKDISYKEGMIRLYLRNTYVPPFEESEDLPRVEIIIRRSYKHHGSTCFRLPFESAREFAKEILDFLGDEEITQNVK